MNGASGEVIRRGCSLLKGQAFPGIEQEQDLCDDMLFPLRQKPGILLGIVVEKELFRKVTAEEREGNLAVKSHKEELHRYLFEMVLVNLLFEQLADVAQVLVELQDVEGIDEVIDVAVNLADDKFG